MLSAESVSEPKIAVFKTAMDPPKQWYGKDTADNDEYGLGHAISFLVRLTTNSAVAEQSAAMTGYAVINLHSYHISVKIAAQRCKA